MAILTDTQAAQILALAEYLEKGSAGKTFDSLVVEQLARIFGDRCGFVCGCPGTLHEMLRDAPYVALLKLLLCVDDGLTLTAAQRARIEATIVRVEAGSAGKYIDEVTSEELARVFCGFCGFQGGCPGTLLEGLRDTPFSTLLRLILCVNTGDLASTEFGPPGVPPVVPPAAPYFLSCTGLGMFAVLAGSTVTNTGLSVIDGDLGLSPGTSVTGFPPGIVLGTQHITDAAAAAAQVELTAAYLDLEGRPGGIPVAGNIGGQTLTAGVYKSASSLAISSGELTLDGGGNADAVFIFQVASALTVTSGRQVILIGGAQAKNVYWQIGSSATIGSTAIFRGNILALTSITGVTGATIDGRMLARNGAVTLDTNTASTPGC